jgi:3-isopropylmalate/(R)-2-methylmalate dehydratase small subunit
MEALRTVTGRAAPLARSDVDTDQIIPSEWLKRVERTGFGAGLFSEWRADPDFVLNQPRHKGAVVLVTGPNFGTGSSREHAVWALMDYGFKAVVSPRFADIFRTNCTKSGLLPVEVDDEVGRALLAAVEADPALEVTVDVEARLPPRRPHPHPLPRRAGRHRPHPAPRGGGDRLRGGPPRLAAGDVLTPLVLVTVRVVRTL